MIARGFNRLIPIIVVLAMLGCTPRSSLNKNRQSDPRVLADQKSPTLRCWLVEDDGFGRQGYVAIDGRLGNEPPGGGGLFQSIDELRVAMNRVKIDTATIQPSFGGAVPPGWRIRDLTTEEILLIHERKLE